MRIAFIDGENFRKSISAVFKQQGKPKPIWHTYDFENLFKRIFQGIKIDKIIFYFARLQEHPETREKSKKLIEERRRLKNYLEQKGYAVVVAGRVRAHMEEIGAFIGSKQILTFKEKGVDVKIAVDMVSAACDGALKEAIIGSSDSDLQPAIEELKKRKVTCVYLGFENAPNKGLTATTERTILIRNAEVLEFERKK